MVMESSDLVPSFCQADWSGEELNNRAMVSASASLQSAPTLPARLRPEVSQFSSSPCVSGTFQAGVPVLEVRVRDCVCLCVTKSLVFHNQMYGGSSSQHWCPRLRCPL